MSTWTKQHPTKPGWYWAVRHVRRGGQRVVLTCVTDASIARGGVLVLSPQELPIEGPNYTAMPAMSALEAFFDGFTAWCEIEEPKPPNVRAGLLDGRWNPSSTVYHIAVEVDGRFVAACGPDRLFIDTGDVFSAAHVPEHHRCQRGACKSQWP